MRRVSIAEAIGPLFRGAVSSEASFEVIAGWRAIELAIGEEDLAALRAIARSRTEPASRVERARTLLAYQEDASFFAVGRAWVRTITPTL